MSPSVFASARLILSSANQDLRMFNKPEIRKVKRCLFGPVDAKATQKFLQDELKKIDISKLEKWNFNFKTERALDSEGLYSWRRATPRKQVHNRPVKSEPSSEVDNRDQYCELTSEIDIVRSSLMDESMSHVHSEEPQRIHQSRITDFMKATKRPLPTCETSKKQPSSTEPPSKIPRLDVSATS